MRNWSPSSSSTNKLKIKVLPSAPKVLVDSEVQCEHNCSENIVGKSVDLCPLSAHDFEDGGEENDARGMDGHASEKKEVEFNNGKEIISQCDQIIKEKKLIYSRQCSHDHICADCTPEETLLEDFMKVFEYNFSTKNVCRDQGLSESVMIGSICRSKSVIQSAISSAEAATEKRKKNRMKNSDAKKNVHFC